MRKLWTALFTILFASVGAAAPATREDQFLIQGLLAGSQTVTTDGTGSVRAEYSFNDRGRGDHIVATWKLDAAGVPIEYSGSGNDYMKAPVTESFQMSGGKARWRNRSEQGEKAVKGEAFYVPANAPPEFTGVLARALLASLTRLSDAQEADGAAWSEKLAKRLTHIPTGDLFIRNARVFDPRDLSITPGMGVLIRNEHVVRVAPDAELKPGDGAQVIDAAGQFLMPGLWDNHQHFFANDGALDLANGVTSARDMANDTDEFLSRVARFDDCGCRARPRSAGQRSRSRLHVGADVH